MPPGTRTLNLIDIGRHLADDDIDPPLRALFIYNHNPIVVHPDQNRMRRGLAREDVFPVGIDMAMTESMAHCDVVLPAATHFEYDDLYPSYGHHWLQRAEPVIPPVGESLPNTEIFRRLAARFGFDDPCFKATDAELMRCRRCRSRRRRAERDLDRRGLADDGAGRQAARAVRQRVPGNASGKIELRSEALAQRWGDGALLPGWRERQPLSADADFAGLGQAHHIDARSCRRAAPRAADAPADAAARGLVHGSEVRVSNEPGRGDPAARCHRRRAAWRGCQREGCVARDQPHRTDDFGAGLRRHARGPGRRRLLQRYARGSGDGVTSRQIPSQSRIRP